MKYQKPFDASDPNAGWVDGNPSSGVQGSIPSAKSFEQPQRELAAAVAGTGQTGSDTDLTQLVQAISVGIYLGTFNGTANALTATIPGSVTIPTLREGMTCHGYVGASPNTGAVTLNLSGFATPPGAKPIVRRDGLTALVSGDLQPGMLVAFRYDGTSFRYVGAAPSEYATGGTGPTSPAPLSALPFRGSAILTPGTTQWTIPTGVYTVWARGVGAGGGSGGVVNTGQASSGCGSGGAFEGPYHMSPTELSNGYVSCAIGTKGAGGSGAPTAGGNGGATSFGNWIAYGGSGSAGVSSGISYTSPVGGQGINAPAIISGSSGSSAFKDSNSVVFGGQGGSCPMGGGIAPSGSQGSYPGGGAAGVASQSGSVAGQPGGDGRILLFW